MTVITHCIFDMVRTCYRNHKCKRHVQLFYQDGLLLDTERVYTEVTQQILDKHANGVRFTWDVKSKLMGRTGDEVCTYFSYKHTGRETNMFL